MQLGTLNQLTIDRLTPPGAFLLDLHENEVLLPRKYLTEEHVEGAEVSVFVFKDSENRIVSTTETPHLYLGEFACLDVVQVNPYGAFVDWGLDKDLFVPFAEQTRRLEIGEKVIVVLRYDHATDRLFGSTKLKKVLEPCGEDLTGQEVRVLIAGKTELGINVIVNNRYSGLIFANNITRPIQYGEKHLAFVRKVREDGKIDIQFEPLTIERFDNAETQVLDRLKESGFLALNDHSSPDEIREELNMSKKLFKQTIGKLYKLKKISIDDNGIRLIQKK